MSKQPWDYPALLRHIRGACPDYDARHFTQCKKTAVYGYCSCAVGAQNVEVYLYSLRWKPPPFIDPGMA